MTAPSLTGRTLIAATVIAALAVALVAHRSASRRSHALAQQSCQPSAGVIAADARRSIDTIARLRDRAQEVTSFTNTGNLVVVRTEDTNRLAPHDGGKVSFDCGGNVRLVWLDGG